MYRRTIVHVITHLGRGGAETIVVGTLKELKEYNNVVVTLYPDNHFEGELVCDKLICLNIRSLWFLPFFIFKFRKIIKQEKAAIVHTHLYWPTMLARIGTPKNIPLITTIHAFIAHTLDYKKKYIRLLDKATYRCRKSIIVADAKGALEEYFSFLNLKPYKSSPLYTFVDTSVFDIDKPVKKEKNIFKIISVGALREQKNQLFLVNAFRLIKDKNIQLDIYGGGPLQDILQKEITNSGVNVNLKGEVKNIQELIPQYDLFVMSSYFEGFSLAVLEAMALKMPLLLSDIPSFIEQCESAAVYFNLNKPEDFVSKLSNLEENPLLRQQLGEKAYQRVLANFTLQHHMKTLRHIYEKALAD